MAPLASGNALETGFSPLASSFRGSGSLFIVPSSSSCGPPLEALTIIPQPLLKLNASEVHQMGEEIPDGCKCNPVPRGEDSEHMTVSSFGVGSPGPGEDTKYVRPHSEPS